MPIQFKVGEIHGEFPEKGSFQTTRTVDGKELRYSVEIREAINRQDKTILQGDIHGEGVEKRRELKPIKDEDKYSLQINEFHNLSLCESDLEKQGYSIKAIDTVEVSSSKFYVHGDYVVFSPKTVERPAEIISESVDVDIDILPADANSISRFFKSTSQATWQNIDENTTYASYSGDIEESESADSMQRSGNLVWAVGEIEYSGEKHRIGVSEMNDSVVFYGKVNAIQAAEIATHIFTSQ